jgi:uncharacterized membrane protein
MRNHLIARVSLFSVLLSLLPLGRIVNADEPVVNALLFYSPSCPHCHKVITEDLPPIIDKFGDQILILAVNTYTEEGNELFLAAVRHFNIPQERQGVPMLIVGETVLVGSYEIPQLFPEIIEEGLVSGGIDWPDIPGLAQLLEDEIIAESNENNPKKDAVEENMDADKEENIFSADINQDEFKEEKVSQEEQSSTVTSDIGDSIVTTNNMTMVDRFMQDKTGNSISTFVLIGMIFSVVFTGVVILRSNHVLNPWPNWVVSILLVIGLAVAIYMAYVEVTRSEAVCGPVGDCNTVQQSPYASLFGLIQIGLLGVLGYIVIGIVWLVSVFGEKEWRKISLISLWGLLLFGTLFSIYLTFLEPFVIGATCAWCLTSAIVMTLLYWNSTAYITQIGGISHLKFIRQD